MKHIGFDLITPDCGGFDCAFCGQLTTTALTPRTGPMVPCCVGCGRSIGNAAGYIALTAKNSTADIFAGLDEALQAVERARGNEPDRPQG